MAPFRSVEEIRNQIGLFESIMEREQRGFRLAPSVTCMVCSETYEESPEMLITILKHTYCKICITAKLQTDDAHEFIIGVLTGWPVNPSIFNRGYDISEKTYSQDSENGTFSLESSDESRGLPRGYIYPNSKLMPNVQDGIGNKARPHSSLRMNAESKLVQKAHKCTGNKKVKYSTLRMSAKPPSQSLRKKQKSEPWNKKWPVSIIQGTASNELTLWSTGCKPPSRSTYHKKQKSEIRKRMGTVGIISETCSKEFTLRSTGGWKNSSNEDWLPEQGGAQPHILISDDDHSDSETVNKP